MTMSGSHPTLDAARPAAALVTCPGCCALVPDIDGPAHRYIGAAPGCWALYGEVLARDYGALGMPPEHRLVVDAYAAQHPGRESMQALRSVATHLVALHLVLERSVPPAEVTRVMPWLAKREDYRWLEPPAERGAITVLDVHRARTPEEHARTCWEWARAVWRAWAPHHQQVRAWAAAAEARR